MGELLSQLDLFCSLSGNARQRMGPQPQHSSGGGRIDAGPDPPSDFIATTMHLTMVSPTEWHSEFVAYLATKCWRLRKSEVMGICRVSATKTRQACLATDFTCARSRMRRAVGKANTVLSTMAVPRRPLPDLDDRRVASILSTLQRSS